MPQSGGEPRASLYSLIPQLPVVARVPLRPIDEAIKAYEGNNVRGAVTEGFKSPAARTALYVASRSLYEAVIPRINDGRTISERALRKALYYLVRMGSRSVPFGTFSAVGTVHAGASTTLRVPADARFSCTRLDMGVVDSMVLEMEMNYDLRSGVVLFTSDFVRHCGPVLVAYSNAHDKPTLQSQVIERTSVVKAVCELACNGIRIADLAQWLTRTLSLATGMADVAIDELLKSGVLVSNLRSSLAHRDHERVMELFSASSPSRNTAMLEVAERLSHLNSTPLDRQPISAHAELNLIAERTFGRQEHYFQTDSTLVLEGTIGDEVLREAAFLAEMSLRSNRRYTQSAAVEAFISRYEGDDVLVPLMELEGSPIVDLLTSAPESGRRHGYSYEGQSRLAQIVSAAILKRSDIALKRDELEDLFEPSSADELPTAVEMGFHVVASNIDAVNRGEFIVVSAPYATFGVGKSIGRTLHMMPERSKALEEWYSVERSREALLAEVVSIPADRRAANVISSGHVLPYEIQVGLHHRSTRSTRLALSELYVGVREQRFFLWSAALKSEILPYRHDNLAVSQHASGVVKFLSLLSIAGRKLCLPFTVPDALLIPYVPRISVSRIVVSPARWRIERRDVSLNAARLTSWREQYRVPRFVWVTNLSNQTMLVDLESARACMELRLAFEQKPLGEMHDVTVQEAIGLGEGWLRGPDGTYIAEFVAAFHKAAEPSKRILRVPIAQTCETRLVNNAWGYFKLYCDPSVQLYVLRTMVKPLLQTIWSYGDTSLWFFVRYADPRPHIRLRFNILDDSRRSCIDEVWQTLALSVRDGLLDDVERSTYRPEMERYGGARGVGIAEQLFAKDSEFALTVILEEDESHHFLRCLEQATLWLQALVPDEDIPNWLECTNAMKRKLDGAQWLLVRQLHAYVSENREVPELENFRHELISLFAGAQVPRFKFIESTLHMHFNRFGLDQESEGRACGVLWQLLAGIVARKRLSAAREQLESDFRYEAR